jgi:hypothetical protein
VRGQFARVPDPRLDGVGREVIRAAARCTPQGASTLLARCSGSCRATTSVLHSSVLAIADELTEDGFVLRYRTDKTDDGLSGKEGPFLICSFCLVSALAIVGEEQRAHDLILIFNLMLSGRACCAGRSACLHDRMRPPLDPMVGCA